MSKITLIGMYNYMADKDDDLFELLNLPEGIDKDVLVSTILMRSGEFEVLYSNPDFVKASIDAWSKKWNWSFSRWINAINIEYNPLENYDRFEDWTDSKGRILSSSNTQTNNLTIHTDIDEEVENQVSAFDTSSYSNKDKITTDADNQVRNTGTISNTSSGTDNGTDTHTGRMHGNIGVTTSQQMLQAELDIALFNLYEKIADLFLLEYVLPIY